MKDLEIPLGHRSSDLDLWIWSALTVHQDGARRRVSELVTLPRLKSTSRKLGQDSERYDEFALMV